MSTNQENHKLSSLQAQLALQKFTEMFPDEAESINKHKTLIHQHLTTGTLPDESSPLRSVSYATPPTAMILEDVDFTQCDEAILEFSLSVVMFILSIMGLKTIGNKLNREMFAAMRGERAACELRLAYDALKGAENGMSKASAICHIFSLVWHTADVFHHLKNALHWYQWIYYGAILLAQLALSFASGMIYLIGKVFFALVSAVNVIENGEKLYNSCKSDPVPALGSKQISLNKQMPDVMGLLTNTYASTAEFWNDLYFFWNGSGKNGIWYTKYNGKDWIAQVSLQQITGDMGVMDNTSPASVFFDKKLFVFWTDQESNNIKFTFNNGKEWSQQESLSSYINGITIDESSSPFACQYNHKLYLFWNAKESADMSFAVFDGTQWSGPNSMIETSGMMGIMAGSSPSAAVYKNVMYVFWNGTGHNGIWYASFDGESWTSQSSLEKLMSGMGVLTNTSPCATVFNNHLVLSYNGSGNNGIWFTKFDGANWTKAGSISELINGMWLMDGTSPSAINYKNHFYSIWNGSGNNGLWYSTFPNNALKV